MVIQDLFHYQVQTDVIRNGHFCYILECFNAKKDIL